MWNLIKSWLRSREPVDDCDLLLDLSPMGGGTSVGTRRVMRVYWYAAAQRTVLCYGYPTTTQFPALAFCVISNPRSPTSRDSLWVLEAESLRRTSRLSSRVRRLYLPNGSMGVCLGTAPNVRGGRTRAIEAFWNSSFSCSVEEWKQLTTSLHSPYKEWATLGAVLVGEGFQARQRETRRDHF